MQDDNSPPFFFLMIVVSIAWFVLGSFQLYIGFVQIDSNFGWGWGLLAGIAFFGFRFTLPISIAAFFGARDIWGWHWIAALIFAAPALLVMIPGIIDALLSGFAQKTKNHTIDTIDVKSREID